MSLFDSVIEQEVDCKVPGCKNKWVYSAKEIVDSWKHNNHQQPKRMCNECKQSLKSLGLLTVGCSAKDCDETLEISPYQQLVLLKKKRSVENQTFFCESCQENLKTIKDKQVPCRMKGCKNTWTWFASSQLKQAKSQENLEPARRLCDSCFQILQSLTVQKKTCRIHHCDNEWELDRMTQLEMKLNHRKAPKRMCTSCSNRLKELEQKELLCIVEGCDKTWTWLPYTQLEHEKLKAKDPSTPEPERYCSSCFALKKRLSPSTVKCKKPTCPNPIEYPVDQQLYNIINHKQPPHRQTLCQTCEEFYQSLTPQAQPCPQEGCANTWEWDIDSQFEASSYQEGVLTKNPPPSHYCSRCHDFLHNRSDIHVDCQQCGKAILWTSRQQLMTELGLWVAPKLCPNCLKGS